MKINKCEEEIDVARNSLCEKIKHMTVAEHTKWSNERAQRLAAKYGLKISKPSRQKIISASK